MLSVAEALAAILRECPPLPAVSVGLAEGAGLHLAGEIVSSVDSPPFDKSMMDGYAVRSSDVPASGTRLRVLGELTAGAEFPGDVVTGEAVRIMTGAPIPAGADAVVRIEETSLDGPDGVLVRTGPIAPGLNVIPRGRMLRSGEVVLAPGRRLRPPELALLAELGHASVVVHRRPSVSVLATGDELVPPGEVPGAGQICNSNGVLLASQAANWGCSVSDLGIARDDEGELHERIVEGLHRDVLILTGGVSMGTRDLVPKVLSGMGVRQVFHKVHLKPGKPVWFGVREGAPGRCLIFALPGNPVSSMVCSELFVRPAARKLQGDRRPERPTLSAVLTRDHRLKEDRPTYFPAWLEVGRPGPEVTPTDWKGSADIRSTIDANSVIAFPAGERTYHSGERVEVLSWD